MKDWYWKVVLVVLTALAGLGVWAFEQMVSYRTDLGVSRLEVADLEEQVDELSGQITALTADRDMVCSAVVESPGCVPTAETRSICSTPPLVVYRPESGDSVSSPMRMYGAVDREWLGERSIWLAVTKAGVDGFFVQGNTSGGAATVTAEGQWTSPSLYIGGADEVGSEWDVVVILADANASSVFVEYFVTASETGETPAMMLPPGAEEYARVPVVRE